MASLTFNSHSLLSKCKIPESFPTPTFYTLIVYAIPVALSGDDPGFQEGWGVLVD